LGAYARMRNHPEMADRTIRQAFEDERVALVTVHGCFDGFHGFGLADLSRALRQQQVRAQMYMAAYLEGCRQSDRPPIFKPPGVGSTGPSNERRGANRSTTRVTIV
jgi:hypothetical protein